MIGILPTAHLLGISLSLFFIGMIGILTRRNLIFILISVEIMLNGVALLLVGASAKWAQADGQIMVLFLMVMAAIEVGLGLALFLSIHQRNPKLDPDALAELKG